jgi:hypothetical protein
MPLLRREPGNENKSAKGGYVLLEAEGGERKLTILSWTLAISRCIASEIYQCVECSWGNFCRVHASPGPL